MFNSIGRTLSLHKPQLFTKTDLHSHLIPEIDDGCDSMAASLQLIRQMKSLGYTKLITTPHIMSHKYPNSIKIIKQGLFELRGMLRVKNIDIEIDAAAEYYFDEYFIALIRKKELFTFGDNYVLFEMSYRVRPKDLEEVVKEMIAMGYKPILAHPERYKFLTEVSEYKHLKNLGIFFQINVNSLGGYYANDSQKKSLMLSQKGMVDFIGSDLHHQKQMDQFKVNIFSSHVKTLFQNNTILNDTI